MYLPKVLIFGQPFNDFSGGGITLSNLFKGWPRDKIAVTFIGHGLINITTDICDTVYQLGREEHKWVFPLNLIQRDFPSGLKSLNSGKKLPLNYIQASPRYKIVNKAFYPFLKWIGLFHALSRISLSDRFKLWISEFKPEILYIQASTRETVNFAKELSDFLRIPSVIHVMDDWPSTISNTGPFKKYWFGKINKEYKQLLDATDIHLSISEAMSEEYLKRYNKNFIPFHNPIDIDRWANFRKTNFEINREHVTILYSGRIGRALGIAGSLIEVASAIESINEEGLTIKFHIQTPTKDKGVLDILEKFKCVVINPFVAYEKIPEVFSQADILLLANDFTKQGIDYLRFSMPTKASEYMISGTPVLVYSSNETAVARFFQSHYCGCCVTNNSKTDLIHAITFLINDADYRKYISQNAVKIAEEKFDAVNVRGKFRDLLANLA